MYAAHLFLNFLLDPVNAGECANYIGYQPVVTEAASTSKTRSRRRCGPTDEEFNQGQFAEDLGQFERAYNDAWVAGEVRVTGPRPGGAPALRAGAPPTSGRRLGRCERSGVRAGECGGRTARGEQDQDPHG